MISKMPVLFLTHGAPLWLTDPEKGELLGAWGKALPTPKSILIVSGHWETEDVVVGEECTHNNLIYDFGGFPKELYQFQYPAPAPLDLSKRLGELLNKDLAKSTRGLDHGVWVPLYHMWPEANIPILQISQPVGLDAQGLFKFGQALAPLREEGVMIIGSGSATHNLGMLDWNGGEPNKVTTDFDDWIEMALSGKDKEALVNFKTASPSYKINHPTDDHFLPLLIAAGAGWDSEVTYPISGYDYANLSYKMAAFG
ncbi:MAG: class III extradiol ring-cleavage dioxygenase [SAR324 cluster bacterium]|nr:class III extradiol ring-cleavage dioxygenase [SAR324 cluster bacterium]